VEVASEWQALCERGEWAAAAADDDGSCKTGSCFHSGTTDRPGHAMQSPGNTL